mgnify:CR=1 FL=1
MKVNKEVTIELNEDDIRKAITHYLKDKKIVSDTADLKITFNITKYTEGEDLFSPGYEVVELKGCKVAVK